MSSQPLWRRWLTRAAFVAVAAGVSAALVVPEDAEARRLGGGKSFGRQSPNATRQATPPSNAQQQNQAAQQPAQQPRNRWLGPLAGLAAGLGIAALLSHFGLVGPLASVLGSLLVIGLLVMAGLFIWRMLRGPRPEATNRQRMEPAYQYAGGSSAGGGPVPGAQLPLGGGAGRPGSVASMDYAPGATSAARAAAPWGVPADFDTPAFLRNAKVYFIRLQADWDSKNLDDIREFTTPEVFAEIKMQLEEEKETQNRTDVVDLDAQLLGIEETGDLYVASVRFEGRIREDDNRTPEPFVEVWNLAKPKSGRGGWLLAGIQQLS